MLNNELPTQVVEAFNKLADDQRGDPERAMLDAQFALGGGVLSYVCEHIGDLTNRGWKKWHLEDAGYDYMVNKTEKTLRSLTNDYGFVKEHYENMTSNAKFYNRDRSEYIAKANDALTAYAKAHSKLKVYNCAQWHAREAAVELGNHNFNQTIEHLKWLMSALETKGKWIRNALQYTLDKDGNIVAIC